MNFYRIKSKQPKCKTCGKLLKEWDPFASEHEHIECASKRITDSIIEGIERFIQNTKQNHELSKTAHQTHY